MQEDNIKPINRNKRIAVNTIVSYGRTLLSVCLVLFSSRWTLQQLGAVDYGLYNLIGSILIIVVFLNTVISMVIRVFCFRNWQRR